MLGRLFSCSSVTVRAVSVSRQTPRVLVGEAPPIPFNITGGTGEELSNDDRYADILLIINRRKSALQLKKVLQKETL